LESLLERCTAGNPANDVILDVETVALDAGARIKIRGEDGTVHEYVVVLRTMYDKDKLPRDLWRKTGPETFVLIACGGDFNNAARRYRQNIVVYAGPVQDTNAPALT
jgi:hypothetical protein